MKLLIVFFLGAAVIAAVNGWRIDEVAEVTLVQLPLQPPEVSRCAAPLDAFVYRGKRGASSRYYSLSHSIVYFRGKCYEFGGDDFNLRNGGIGRGNPLNCPQRNIRRMGLSSCTRADADRMATGWQAHNTYHGTANNCHHFAYWLIEQLTRNRCS